MPPSADLSGIDPGAAQIPDTYNYGSHSQNSLAQLATPGIYSYCRRLPRARKANRLLQFGINERVSDIGICVRTEYESQNSTVAIH